MLVFLVVYSYVYDILVGVRSWRLAWVVWLWICRWVLAVPVHNFQKSTLQSKFLRSHLTQAYATGVTHVFKQEGEVGRGIFRCAYQDVLSHWRSRASIPCECCSHPDDHHVIISTLCSYLPLSKINLKLQFHPTVHDVDHKRPTCDVWGPPWGPPRAEFRIPCSWRMKVCKRASRTSFLRLVH